MSSEPPGPAEETVRRVLDREGDLAYVVGPAPSVLEAIVAVLDEIGAVPGTRFLVETELLKDQVADFLFASTLANLTERGAVTLRTAGHFRNANLLVFPDEVVQLFDLEVRLAAVATDTAETVSAIRSQADEQWAAATPYELRTPARETISETLETHLGDQARSDFSAIVGSLETARGNGNGLDEVTIALLVAAKNEALLYDISKWGEDVGLASKATFSRTKSTLEDLGIIATEKVPIDVGRPRLRLKFADQRLRSASPDELASVAIGLLE